MPPCGLRRGEPQAKGARMNLSQLEYFDAAARLGSFARAAKALFVTP